MMLYYDWGVLSPEDRATLLTKIRVALKPGGLLLFDVYYEPYAKYFEQADKVDYVESGFWSDEAHVVLHKKRLLEDSLNTLDHYLIITEDELKEYRIWNQIYDLSSLRSELKNHGFTIVGIYADARGTPFYQDSETLCVLARLI